MQKPVDTTSCPRSMSEKNRRKKGGMNKDKKTARANQNIPDPKQNAPRNDVKEPREPDTFDLDLRKTSSKKKAA
jgi:hypothetical protein